MTKNKSLQDKLKEKFQKGDTPHAILMNVGNSGDNNTNDNTGDNTEEVKSPVIQQEQKVEKKEPEVKPQEQESREPPQEQQEQSQETSTKKDTSQQPQTDGRKSRKSKEKKESEFRRKDNMKETHVSRTNYVHKDIQSVMDIVCTGWGESYKFLNVALRDYILDEENVVEYLEENDPDLLERIKRINYKG